MQALETSAALPLLPAVELPVLATIEVLFRRLFELILDVPAT
jgi:hypothetical protein